MTVFWIFVVILLTLAFVYLLPPLVRRRVRVDVVDQEAINVQLYKERLEELRGDQENGLLNEEQFATAQADLEKSLLYDLSGSKDKVEVAAPRGPGRWVAAVVIAFGVPVASLALYSHLGASKLLPALEAAALERQMGGAPTAAAQAQTPPHPGAADGQQAPSVEEMIAGLAKRMEDNPDDPKGWYMLARSYTVTQQYPDAVKAYDNAYRLVPNDPDVLAGYAEVLALASDSQLRGRPTELLDAALVADPNHTRANWLRGFAHYQAGEVKAAIAQWEKLLAQVPPESPDRENIAQIIREARAEIGMADASPAAAPQPAQPAVVAAADGKTITVSVNLAGELAAKASPGDTLFLFARAVEGPRMPLAVVRKRVADLPFTVTLDDSMAMSPAMVLSNFPEVSIEARVSKSGNAMPSSGDLRGMVSPVKPGGGDPIALLIDAELP